MISWIQRNLLQHFKLIFGVLLGLIIVSFVFVTNASSGFGNTDRQVVTREFFGHNLGSEIGQARVFREVVDVTGIVLTKLDGSAKGGIVVAVQRELGVPVKLVGVGEGADDLAPFDPETFVDALLDQG